MMHKVPNCTNLDTEITANRDFGVKTAVGSLSRMRADNRLMRQLVD